MKNEILEIGQVVNTHGIKGEIKVQPWCDDPCIYDELEYIYIGGKKYEILRSRFHKNCEILAVEGINNIEEASLLRNKVVTIEREKLGKLPEGRYYIVDILGLEVKIKDGDLLGVIDDVIHTGSNDVYQVKREGKKPVLIPVIPDVINEVNIDDGYVVITPMKGLIDDEV